MRIKTSLRDVCQHNYYCIQHCRFVNSTKISDVIKICVLASQTEFIIYTHFKHGTGNFFYCISLFINSMLCHGYVPTIFLHAAVIPIPKNTKLNFSSASNCHCIIEYFWYLLYCCIESYVKMCTLCRNKDYIYNKLIKKN